MTNTITMKFLKALLLIAMFFLFTTIVRAQNTTTLTDMDHTSEWVKMMSDQNINFYDVQKAANSYYETHDKGKGSGWKQFKRWEYLTEQRVFPSGNRHNHPILWDEMKSFNQESSSHSKLMRSNWTELGPHTSANVTGHWSPGIGRINVIAIEPNNPQTIYIGSPSGGLWKTTDEGQNWQPLTDNQPVLGVSAIAIDPSNTDIIYIGTGDKDANDNYSIGILKSTDGGTTWNTTGMEWTIYQNRTIAKLLINPNNPNILFAATTVGLFKTTNAGENWTNILSGDIDDLEFKPFDYNTIYASTRRFFKSTDGGDNFSETSGVPNSSRVQIAVSEDNPDVVYFFSSGSGIYRSDDAGESFTFRSNQPTSGNQAWYDLAMAVSHTNADDVHLGEINTWKSFDGALTWSQTTDWTWGNNIGYTHCDIHEMVFYGNTLYVGSDGLISKSIDNGATWTNLTEGIGMRQFYRIGTSKNDPYKIMGGSQDNGTSVYTDGEWHEWLGADGMECLVDYTNSNIVYGTSQYGTFYKSTTGGNFGGVAITQPGSGNWVTPFVIHPTDPQTLYVGNSEVRKTTDGMSSWTTITSLGLGNLDNLAISPSQPDQLYLSKSNKIYRTSDGGENWTNITNGLPNLFITYIAIHPEKPETIAVSLSGYQEGEKVYFSENGGNTWINYSNNLPNIPANCVAFYNGDLNPLYIGMDVGVYYTDNLQSEWSSYMEGLPNVIVTELEIQFDAGLIRAATYGRGLWEANIQLNVPIADFKSDQQTIPVGCNISFESLSQGPPETYEWVFEEGTPSTSTEKNPANIVYDTEGIYDVQLTVSNALGSDVMIKEDYVSISSTLVPTTNFSTADTVSCSLEAITFTDETLYCPISWEWSFNPDTYNFAEGTDAHSQNPVVVFESGVYSATLTTTNSIGSNSLTKTGYIHAGGAAMPFYEGFEVETIDQCNWTIENPDGLITWDIASVSGSPSGDKASRMNMINYQGFGKRDRLISPALNLSGFNNLTLTFDHAYALRYMQFDSLIVYISVDCGENWSRIFANGPDGLGAFETSTATNDPFIPQSADDWCGAGYGSECTSIDLSGYIGSINAKIMFESYCQFGNNLYVDNVRITNSVGISENQSDLFQFDIIPNPSSGIFDISVQDVSGLIRLNIMNAQGQSIFSTTFNENKDHFTQRVDLSDHTQGIYFVEIRTQLGAETKKIVIQ